MVATARIARTQIIPSYLSLCAPIYDEDPWDNASLFLPFGDRLVLAQLLDPSFS